MSLKASLIWSGLAAMMGGSIKWLQYAQGGLTITHLSLWYAPRGVPGGGRLMKTFHRHRSLYQYE